MADLLTDTIHWSDEEVTLREFAEKFSGPQLVRLGCATSDGNDGGPVVELGSEVNTERPFLAYSKRLRTKVYGQALVRDGDTSEYVVSSSMLELPKDYPGWFDILPDGGDELQPFVSVQQVADAACRRFLTVSPLVGFLTSTGDDGDIRLITEKKVYPGEELKITGVACRKWKVKADLNMSATPKTLLLKCIDQANREICFPLAHPGRFYAVTGAQATGQDESTNTCCIYRLSDIVDSFQLPLNVSLVFGWTPWLPDATRFAGLLRLRGMDRPETLVTYNFVPNKNVFVELPIDLDVKVRRATDCAQFELSPAYKAAVAMCRKKAFPFVSSIKTVTLVHYGRRRGSLRQTSEETPFENEIDTERHCSGYLPIAINMDDFNPLRLFPPMDCYEAISDGAALSFTDSENRSCQQVSEDGFDFSFHLSAPDGYKLCKDMHGGPSMKSDQVEAEAPPFARGRDLRESRENDVRSREATC